MYKLLVTLLLLSCIVNFTSAACDPSKLLDAELSLLFDDALPFDLIPKRMEYPLNTQRFTNAKLNEGLQFFKTRFGIDFTNANSQPKYFRLEKGSFEGYSVVGAVTNKSRFFGSPLIRVYADMLTVVSLNSTNVDPLTQYPIPKDAIAQFGYYSFYYRANNTKFTEPIKVTSQTFQEGWRDAQQNLDHSRNIIFDLYSPEWGVGASQGVVTMPMHDSTLGKSQVSMREWLRFPPVGTAKRGDVTTCQSWLN
ncbi:predicted protein [Naegleria gruberi]|uniref:Predicted protein n=1 Tax=Naegleria gruberi TaxID=5762 RepID=D2VY19_NAEGR|nr:uncharacterized protein NAEGRDRAFT_73941 [Naegleria gruberi]EFC38288.1 predicted protein [Naegleria gruberi]|eukprot:XP_002671032.1 predicted protein [Naegleria gruberi strain NEG-M]